MALTIHGWLIPGTDGPPFIGAIPAWCGGPGTCLACSEEVGQYIIKHVESITAKHRRAPNETKDLDPTKGVFISVDELVINYGGENFYKACGMVVRPYNGLGAAFSTCVKRVNHPGDVHEDYDGNTVNPSKLVLEDYDGNTVNPSKLVLETVDDQALPDDIIVTLTAVCDNREQVRGVLRHLHVTNESILLEHPVNTNIAVNQA